MSWEVPTTSYWSAIHLPDTVALGELLALGTLGNNLTHRQVTCHIQTIFQVTSIHIASFPPIFL